MAFVESHAAEVERLDNGKIRCTLTGTDLPPKIEVLEAFWSGRTYRAALKRRAESWDLSKYAPHIIPHKSLATKVYCRRTKRILNKDKDEIERHMQGRRFKFALSQWKPKPVPADGEASKPASGSSTLTSGDDDIWSRMALLPGEVADREGVVADDVDPDASSDEEADMARALIRHHRGSIAEIEAELDEEDEDDENDDEEDDEMDDDDDDGVFEEVPLSGSDVDEDDEADEMGEEDSTIEADGQDEEDVEQAEEEEKEEDEDEAPAPPPTKKRKASSAASTKLSSTATSSAPVAPLAARKRVEDHRPIGPPSKRDLKKAAAEAKAHTEKADAATQKTNGKSAPSASSSAASQQPQPGKLGRMNASERRKLKKQQKAATNAAATKDDNSTPQSAISKGNADSASTNNAKVAGKKRKQK